MEEDNESARVCVDVCVCKCECICKWVVGRLIVIVIVNECVKC